MKDEIKNLIQSIASGNAAESEEMLNGIMAQKAVTALDDMRMEVAKSMFTQPEAEPEAE